MISHCNQRRYLDIINCIHNNIMDTFKCKTIQYYYDKIEESIFKYFYFECNKIRCKFNTF